MRKKQITFAEVIDDGIPGVPSRKMQVAFVKNKLKKVFKAAIADVKLDDQITPEQFRDSFKKAKEAVKNALEHEKSIHDPDLFQNELSETPVNLLVNALEAEKKDKLAELVQDALQDRMIGFINMNDRSPHRRAPEIVTLIKVELNSNYNFLKRFALKTDVQINEFHNKDVQSICQYIEAYIKSYVEDINEQNSMTPEKMLASCNEIKKEIIILLDILREFNPVSYNNDKIEQWKNSTQKEINAKLKSYLYFNKKPQLSVHDTPISNIVFFNILNHLADKRTYTLLVYAIAGGKVASHFNEKCFVSDRVTPSLLAAIESMLMNIAFASVEEAEKFFFDVKTAAYSIKDEAAKIPHMQSMVNQLLLSEYNRLNKCDGFAGVRAEAKKAERIKSLEDKIKALSFIADSNNGLNQVQAIKNSFFHADLTRVLEMQYNAREIIEHLKDPSKPIPSAPPMKPLGGALEKVWMEIDAVRAELVLPTQPLSQMRW